MNNQIAYEKLVFNFDTRYRQRSASLEDGIFEFIFQPRKSIIDNMHVGNVGSSPVDVYEINSTSMTVPNFLKLLPSNIAASANEVKLKIISIGYNNSYTTSASYEADHHFAFMICRTPNADSRSRDIMKDKNLLLHPIAGRDIIRFIKPFNIKSIKFAFFIDDTPIVFEPEMLTVDITVGMFNENTITSKHDHKLSLADKFVLTQNNSIPIVTLNPDMWKQYCINNMEYNEFHSDGVPPMDFTTEQSISAYPVKLSEYKYKFGDIYSTVIYDMYLNYNQTNRAPRPPNNIIIDMSRLFNSVSTVPINAISKYQRGSGVEISKIRDSKTFNFKTQYFDDSSKGTSMVYPRDVFIRGMIENINSAENNIKTQNVEYAEVKIKSKELSDRLDIATSIIAVDIENAYHTTELILNNSAFRNINVNYVNNELYYDFDILNKFPITGGLIMNHTYTITFGNYDTAMTAGGLSRGNILTLPELSINFTLINVAVSGIQSIILLNHRPNTFFNTIIDQSNVTVYRDFIKLENSISVPGRVSTPDGVISGATKTTHLFNQLTESHEQYMKHSNYIDTYNYKVIEQGILNTKLSKNEAGVYDIKFDTASNITYKVYSRSVYKLSPVMLSAINTEEAFANVINIKFTKPCTYIANTAVQSTTIDLTTNTSYEDGDVVYSYNNVKFVYQSSISVIDTVYVSMDYKNITSKYLIVGSTVNFIHNSVTTPHVITPGTNTILNNEFIGVDILTQPQAYINKSLIGKYLEYCNVPAHTLALYDDLDILDSTRSIADINADIVNNTTTINTNSGLVNTIKKTLESSTDKQLMLLNSYKYYIEKGSDCFCITTNTGRVVEVNVDSSLYSPVEYVNEINKHINIHNIIAELEGGRVKLSSANSFSIKKATLLDSIYTQLTTNPLLLDTNIHPRAVNTSQSAYLSYVEYDPNYYTKAVTVGDYIYSFSRGTIFVYSAYTMKYIYMQPIISVGAFNRCKMVAGVDAAYFAYWSTGTGNTAVVYKVSGEVVTRLGEIYRHIEADDVFFNVNGNVLTCITDVHFNPANGANPVNTKLYPVLYDMNTFNIMYEGRYSTAEIRAITGNVTMSAPNALFVIRKDSIDINPQNNIAGVYSAGNLFTSKVVLEPVNGLLTPSIKSIILYPTSNITTSTTVSLTHDNYFSPSTNLSLYRIGYDGAIDIDDSYIIPIVTGISHIHKTLINNKLYTIYYVGGTTIRLTVHDRITTKTYNFVNKLTPNNLTLPLSVSINPNNTMLFIYNTPGVYESSTYNSNATNPNTTVYEGIKIPLLPFDLSYNNFALNTLTDSNNVTQVTYTNSVLTKLSTSEAIINTIIDDLNEAENNITLAVNENERLRHAITYKMMNYKTITDKTSSVDFTDDLYRIESLLVSLANNADHSDTISTILSDCNYKVKELEQTITAYNNLYIKILSIISEIYSTGGDEDISNVAYDMLLNSILNTRPELVPSISTTNIYSENKKQLDSYINNVNSFNIASLQTMLKLNQTILKNLLYNIRLYKNQSIRYKLLAVCHLLGLLCNKSPLSNIQEMTLSADNNNVVLMYLLDYTYTTSIYILDKQFTIPLSMECVINRN